MDLPELTLFRFRPALKILIWSLVVMEVVLLTLKMTGNLSPPNQDPVMADGTINSLPTVVSPNVAIPKSSTETSHATNTIKVLMMTHYRGGSSFLGESINRNPDGFYMFEPLINIFRSSEAVESSANGNYLKLPEAVRKEALRTLHNILNCKLSATVGIVFACQRIGFLNRSLRLGSVIKCIRSSCTNPKRCLAPAEQICSNATVRAIKTIRIDMTFVPHLLDKDPDIKVIYYVRDPRGILSSRYGIKYKAHRSEESVKDEAKGLCDKIEQDLVIVNKLQNEGFVVFLKRYEDFARDTTAFLDDEYEQLTLGAPPKDVVEQLYGLAHSREKSGKYNTARPNASATAQGWQEKLSSEVEVAIVNSCRSVMKKLGYTTDILSNSTIKIKE